MGRSVLSWVCVCVLSLMLSVGCSETAGTAVHLVTVVLVVTAARLAWATEVMAVTVARPRESFRAPSRGFATRSQSVADRIPSTATDRRPSQSGSPSSRKPI